MTTTVTGVLLKIMKKHGIRNVFGLPAAQIGQLMDGASKDPFFNYITVRHEEAAGHMAHAVGKLTDEMAVCFATVGPGATNMVPGVAAAWADNIPLLVITPNNRATVIDPPRDLLQSADHISLYKPITKWNAGIRYPERAGELIERAIHIARSGRPGPVHLDIPCDIGTAPCDHDVDSIPAITPARPVPSPGEMEQVISLLREARRPVLLAGGGVVRSGGVEVLRLFLEQTGILATTSLNARGCIPLDSPHYIGCGGILGGRGAARAVSEADVVLAVGCKFSSWIPIDKPPLYPLNPDQKIIQIDTDGEVLGRGQRLALGLVGDAREFLGALSEKLGDTRLEPEADWYQEVRKTHEEYREEVDAIADKETIEGTGLINEAALARTLSEALPEDTITIYDGGQIMEWTHTFIRPRDPRSFGFAPGMGHLGFGLPFANAAKLNFPDRPVVVITGDGAMGMTGQEMETAVRYGLNVVAVVANDSCWGMYRPFGEEIFQNKNFGTNTGNVDFAKVAEGYGAAGFRVEELADVKPALAEALAAGRPAVVDVVCDFMPHPIDAFWPGVILKGMDLSPVEC